VVDLARRTETYVGLTDRFPVEHRHVITGPSGSGKTSLIRELAASGSVVVDEPARAVIAEQRALSGDRVYERGRQLFLDLMLTRAIADFDATNGASSPTFFDRGIPDLIGYARLFDLDDADATRTAQERRYNEAVFVLPSWIDIYTTDDDRKMTFAQADAFGRLVREIYVELGYIVVDIRSDTIPERARLVLEATRD
jgi:predicted ATPase